MLYRHQILFVTTPIEGGGAPPKTTLLKERISEEADPAPPYSFAWPDPTRQTPRREVVVRMILGNSYLSWMHKHRRAKPLSEGQRFPSLQEASRHLGIGPTRLSVAFSQARALGDKYAQLPKGVVWGYVEDPQAVPPPEAAA